MHNIDRINLLFTFQLFVVSAAAPRLPLQIEDASRRVDDPEV